MKDRLTRLVVIGLLILLAILVVQPYVDRFLFTANGPRPIQPRGKLSDVERARIDLFKRLSPSVVHVASRVDTNQLSASSGRAQGQTGSGFIWDSAGHIVTNDHVVKGASSLMVRLASGEALPARVVGAAPPLDLAVLLVAVSHKLPPPIPVARSAELKVGQTAFAIGNPFGLDPTLSTGIISALKRRLPTSGGREISDAIQTDAAITPGNSGGPLVDSAGRLIGVDVALLSAERGGMGYAIPVDVVNRVVPELIRTGKAPIPGIGIIVGDEGMATRLGVQGVVVVRTLPGSPAQKAGLQGIDPHTGALGDIIVAANGRPVHRLADLVDEMAKAGIGHSLDLNVLRGDTTASMKAKIVDISNLP